MRLRLIGDIHGHYDKYIELTKGCDRSIQLGDLGFRYDCLDKLDHAKHKVLAGNHDNYHIMNEYPHFLGDYGYFRLNGDEHSLSFFYVRGGLSIDAKERTAGVDWWPEEELGYGQSFAAYKEYMAHKPLVMLSHSAPAPIGERVSRRPSEDVMNTFGCKLPSDTGLLLDHMWYAHQPEWWFFGHFHVNTVLRRGITQFRCIGECNYYDLEL